MAQYKDLSPLDEEGMRSDRPPWEVKWTRLENVIFRDGSIRLRPGMRNVLMTQDEQTTYNPGAGVALPFIRHPGSTITDRETSAEKMETIVPTATVSNVTWSIVGAGGTVHGSIDEDPPDNASQFVRSTVHGDKFVVSYGNPSTTYDDISGVLIRGRARSEDVGGDAAQLSEGKVTIEVNGTDVTIPDTSVQLIQAGEFVEDSGNFFWEDFAVWLPTNPATSKRWTRSDVTALQVGITNANEETVRGVSGYLKFTTNGAHTDWGTIGDITLLRVIDGPFGGSYPKTDIMEPSAVGDQQSFKLPASQIFGANVAAVNSILSVQLKASFYGPIDTSTTADISLFHRAKTDQTETKLTLEGGLRYLAPSKNIGANATVVQNLNLRSTLGRLLPYTVGANVDIEFRDYHTFMTELITLNPEDGAAWAETDLQSSEWGVTFEAGDATYPPALKSIELIVRYNGVNTSDQRFDLTSLVADVYGTTNKDSTNQSDMSHDRLYFGTHGAFRLNNEAVGIETRVSSGWKDVSGSIPNLTTPGDLPLDWAVLFGQVFVVNGQQNTFFYPNGSSVFDQLADNTTGKTVASFADRLIVGWVKDGASGKVTPERIAYSGRNDATDWTGVLAGDFDLIQTPGGVVKLEPLTEDLLVAYKERGIYNIRQTGNFVAPLQPDLVDSETECLAKRSVVRVITEDGSPYHLFLGRNPTSGVTVFGYNGQQLLDMGKPIARNILNESDPNTWHKAHAAVDPQTNSYWLFIANYDDAASGQVDVNSPNNAEGVPETAWVMDLRTGSWTRAVFPWPVSCSGAWPFNFFLTDPLTIPSAELGLGRMGASGNRLVMTDLRSNYLKYADPDVAFDDIRSPAATVRHRDSVASTGRDQNRTDSSRKGIYAVIETGDLRLSKAELHNILYRLHIYAPNRGPVHVVSAVSITGGSNYQDYQEQSWGNPVAAGTYLHSVLELDGVEGRRHRVQLVYQPFSDELPGILDIHEMVLQFEVAGDNP